MKTKLVLAAGIIATSCFTIDAQASDWREMDCGDNWGPTNAAAPAYPRRARERGIEGYIVLSYGVDSNGTVVDIAVTEAKPETAFVRAATRAISKLEFSPCIEGGRAVKVSDLSIKYDFNLN